MLYDDVHLLALDVTHCFEELFFVCNAVCEWHGFQEFV